jgi:hypothetical protein
MRPMRAHDILLHPVNLVPFGVYPLFLVGRHFGFVANYRMLRAERRDA